jgi:ankyrin repeat protein
MSFSIVRLLRSSALGFFLVLPVTAIAQEPAANKLGSVVGIVPNTIVFLPPVARAVLTRDPKQVDAALAERADINEAVRAKEGSRAGFTPIILAAALADADIVKKLIKNGARLSIPDDFHRSAFWYAAETHNVEITQLLIEGKDAGDAINMADNDLKQTPLQIAVRDDDSDLVRLLTSKGASPDKKDILGETAIEYCRRDKNEACAFLR